MDSKEKEYELIIFQDVDFSLDVKVDYNRMTIWLTQDQIATLCEKDRTIIVKQIKSIFNNYELESESSCAKFAQVQQEGNRQITRYVKHYNLDIITLVENRIKSKRLTKFKEWSANVLSRIKPENGEIQPLIVFRHNDISIDVRVSPDEETVWLTKEQITILFDTTRQNVDYHINNIYTQNELEEWATCKEILQVQIENGREVQRNVSMYNLDMIISLGYRINSKNGIIFRKWANSVLKEYLLKGYAINENRTLITNENYVNLINKVDSIDERLKKVEGSELYYKKEKLIVNGEIFDATAYLESIVSSTRNKILLVDPYVDSKALNILKYVNYKVDIRIISSNKSKLSNIDINNFIKQYNTNITLSTDNSFHDRYLFIDDKVFHLGSSINYLGNKISQIDEVLDDGIKDYLINRINY